jgi:hypothetical protein
MREEDKIKNKINILNTIIGIIERRKTRWFLQKKKKRKNLVLTFTCWQLRTVLRISTGKRASCIELF